MTKCRSCGAEVLDAGRFCSSCGAPLASDPFTTADVTAPEPSPQPAPKPSSKPGPKWAETPRSAGRTPSSGLATEERFLPGSLLAGRYRIVARLGKGGMGEVYRADDLTLGQPVALKFLPEAASRNEDALARFRNEVRTARRVAHPNVCRIYDVGEVEGHTFLSMEYVDGEDLASLLRRIGRVPADKAVEIARQLCAGLAAAHREGVLHRDLKPANVMIDGRGHAVITDFGLAGFADQIQGLEVRSGTPAYMAPEQLAGQEVTAKSDIYSLGLVLYEIFTGKRAFEAETLAELLRTRRERAPSNPSSLVKDLDPAVERVIMRCLEAEPANRPPSALAVAAALPGGDPLAAALAAGETPSPGMVAAAGQTAGVDPRLAAAALAGTLVALALSVYLAIRQSGVSLMAPPYSPEVLNHKAGEIARSLGYSEPPADSAGGFSYDQDLIDYLHRQTMSAHEQMRPEPAWDKALAARPQPLGYWYRQSPRQMIAPDLRSMMTPGLVTADDPPPVVSTMVNLELDPKGRLVYFQAIPAEEEEHPEPARAADWNLLFTAAGLDAAQLRPVEPAWNSLAAADTRAAWTGTWPGGTLPLRVEAAAWRGKPVFFRLIGPWTRPERMQPSNQTAGQKAGETLRLILFALTFVAGVLLARRNYRQGKGDRQGALRLAGTVFLVELALWLCLAHLVPSFDTFGLFALAVSTALFVSGVTAMLYLALEPYVRRHWPQTIISWSRVMAGRLRDPLVGRDVLWGLLMGLAWVVVFRTGYIFLMHAGAPPQFEMTDFLLGARQTLGTSLANVVNSVLGTLMFFFLAFMLRVVFRNSWLAAVLFVAILTAPKVLSSDHPLVETPLWAIIYAIAAVAVVRFGLIVLATAVYTANILLNLPFTLNFSAWYATNGLAVLLFFVALAGWSFVRSLGGQRLWKTELFE